MLAVFAAGCWFSFCLGAPKREFAGGLPAGVVDGKAEAVLFACGVVDPLCEALPPPGLLKRPPEEGAADFTAPPPKGLLLPWFCWPGSAGFGVDAPDPPPKRLPPPEEAAVFCWFELPKRPPLFGAGATLPNTGSPVDALVSLSLFKLPKMLLPPSFPPPPPPPNADKPPEPCCCADLSPNRLDVDGFEASGAELTGVVL